MWNNERQENNITSVLFFLILYKMLVQNAAGLGGSQYLKFRLLLWHTANKAAKCINRREAERCFASLIAE